MRWSHSLFIAIALAGCSGNPQGGEAFQEQLENASKKPDNWLTYGGSYDEQRHSGLKAITLGNVAGLGLAWSYDLGVERGAEATPLVDGGIMYVTSAWSIVHAIDGSTGKKLWSYDPKVDKAVSVNGCCDAVNRGVAIYGERVFASIFDGRLVALDRKTGKALWSVVTVDQIKPYTITGAPRVANGKVYIGNSGAEYGVRGYVSAYDASNGKLVWRFYTTPNPNKKPDNAASDKVFEKFANATWGDKGAWQSQGGGGTVWDSIVYDQVNKQIIFGVGNGSPWNAKVRDPNGTGDNLFISSIVAVDADSGAYRWHFQTTPRDQWDYTATQSIILADLPWSDGQRRRVVMQAPKNGYFYVLDATSGRFLAGKPYVEQNWTTGLTPEGRPIRSATADYTENGTLMRPGAYGGHNWHPMAYSPDLNLAFIPGQETPFGMAKDTLVNYRPAKYNTGVDFAFGAKLDPSPGDLKAVRAMMKGRLVAWDVLAGKPRWSVEHDGPWSGGVLSTASGLVFQGKLNGEFVAYAAKDGRKLWSIKLPLGIVAAPITYSIDGEQYVAVLGGWGTAYPLAFGIGFERPITRMHSRVFVFKLGGKADVPVAPSVVIDATPKAAIFGDKKMLEYGKIQYARNCAVCHGVFAISSGVLPDLRWSAATGDPAVWRSIVFDGALAQNGMVSFKGQLPPYDAEAVRSYVVYRANETVRERGEQ